MSKKAESLEEFQRQISSAFYDQFSMADTGQAEGLWIVETFTDYVIVNKAETYYLVAYNQDEDGFNFADRGDWEEVEKQTEWIATMKRFATAAIKKLDEDDDTITIGGYGVVFEGRDLQMEEFEADTDYMLDLVPSKVITYDHTMPDERTKMAIKDFLGHTSKEVKDKVGIWVEAQLEKSNKYVKLIMELMERGIPLGWSSGTAPHLVLTKGHRIKRWPIIEYALTPTPAEPRLLGVEKLKNLAEKYPSLQVALQESQDSKMATKVEASNLLLQIEANNLLVELSDHEDQRNTGQD